MGSAVSRGTSDLPTGTFIGKGSVFEVNETNSLICFVTKCFTMEGRIQHGFKTRFGSQAWLKNQEKNKGEIVVMNVGTRYIYYIVVKDTDYKKINLADLRTGLDAVVVHAGVNSVAKICMSDVIFSEITTNQLITEVDGAFDASGIEYQIISESYTV